MAHVFISYSRKDKAFAAELKKQLREAGLNEWMDNKIPGGRPWLQEIEIQLRNSYAIVIVVTEDAINSEWVNYEWMFARGADVEIIPIYLRDVQKFPCRLNDYQLLDFRNTYEWRILIDRLQDISQQAIDREPLQKAKIDLNDTNPQVQRNAIKALVDMNAVETLALSVFHPNRAIRIAAAFALTEVTKFTDKRAVSGLLEALKDTEWTTKRDAANALGKLGDSAATSVLIMALNDRIGDVRWAAAHALGEIGDPNSITSLINTLKDSTYPTVQSIASESLASIGELAVPELLKVINDKELGDNAHLEAANALGKIGDPIAVKDLIYLLFAKNWEVRRRAIKALGKIGDLNAIPKLIEVMSDPQNMDLDKDAASALAKIGQMAIPSLLEATQDSIPHVRELAVTTLGEIGKVDTIPHLIEMLCDTNKDVQNAAALALAKIGKPCINRLLATILNPNSCGREYAIGVLGDIGSKENIEILLKILREEGKSNSRICLAVIHALGNIGDPDAIPDLIDQLSNNTIVDVVAATFGIIQIQMSQHASQALVKIRTPEALAAVEKWQSEQRTE